MARKKSSRNLAKLSTSEKIKNTEAEIEAISETLAQKKKELKELKDQKVKEDMEKVLEVIKNSGLTPDEIIERINKAPEEIPAEEAPETENE